MKHNDAVMMCCGKMFDKAVCNVQFSVVKMLL